MRDFTQGEWKAFKSELLKKYQGQEAIIHTGEFMKDGTCTGDYIATVHTMSDARLIAGAPEMYDVLCEVAYFLEQSSTYDGDEFAAYARIIRSTLALIDGTEAH